MYKFKQSDDKSIFYVEIVDKTNHTQIIEFLQLICENGLNNKNIFIITDYRKAIIDEPNIEPIKEIGVFINSKMKPSFEHIKWANISIGHLPTTGAILLHELIKGKEIEYEPFTTIEGAIHWIGLSLIDFEKLIKIINTSA